MKNRAHITQLFDRYLRGDYTQEDLEVLLDYFGRDEEGTDLKGLIEQALETPLDVEAYKQQIDEVDDSVRASLRKGIDPRSLKQSKVRIMYVGIAASLIVGILIGTWVFLGVENKQSQATNIASLEIEPGKNRAELVMDDGRSIELSEDKTGVTTGRGEIAYTDGTTIVAAKAGEYVTLSTPRAGQYQAMLPDGTQVWLNAESSVRYPTTFAGKTREVEITGEVFFDVATDVNRPFLVKCQEQELIVLGTSFNIKAYSNEPTVTTTLVTGSVRVIHDAGRSVATLLPGQQAILDGNKIAVNQVDVRESIAWKDGVYVLNNSNLEQLLRQLERWYNVEVAVWPQGEKRLSAIIPRDANLREVLQAIEMKTGLTFKVEERRIITIE